MTTVLKCFAFVTLAALFHTPATLLGQSHDGSDTSRWRRFSVVLEAGGGFGGPAESLAGQLREAGFNDRIPRSCFLGHCTPSRTGPTEDGPIGYGGISMRYALTKDMTLAATIGGVSLGGSSAYRERSDSDYGDKITSLWNASMTWVGMFWTPRAGMRLGAGTAWYELNGGVSRLGAMAEAGVEYPTDTRFFLNFAARINVIPSQEVQERVTSWDFFRTTDPVMVSPNWTHGTILGGLGLRL